MFLIEFLFANCMNEIPIAAAERENNGKSSHQDEIKVNNTLETQQNHLPTMPNKTQYMAANIGKGIDAKKAPNFPEGMR